MDVPGVLSDTVAGVSGTFSPAPDFWQLMHSGTATAAIDNRKIALKCFILKGFSLAGAAYWRKTADEYAPRVSLVPLALAVPLLAIMSVSLSEGKFTETLPVPKLWTTSTFCPS